MNQNRKSLKEIDEAITAMPFRFTIRHVMRHLYGEDKDSEFRRSLSNETTRTGCRLLSKVRAGELKVFQEGVGSYCTIYEH